MADRGPAPWDGRKVVLVHDWLTGMRGGEKVLEAICRIFPGAPLLTLLHVDGSVSATISQGRRIRTSVIQRLPKPAQYYRHYLPLFPAAIEGFDLDDADLIISTSSCAAKAVVATGRARHLCYCFSPMRYAWDQFDAYFGEARMGAPAARVLRPLLAWIARWDRDTAARVTHFAADSRYVAGRIARYYNRRASVLYPPVATDFFTPAEAPPEPYFLAVSALVPYKRIDLAVGAARELGVPLKVVGTGPDDARLRAQAGPTVEFLGAVDGERLRELYRHAQALVLPAEEDFGIGPVESMACGRPVVAFGRGGAEETVEPGVTGVLVASQTAPAFAEAMDACRRMAFDPAVLRARALQFSPERFDAGFREILSGMLTAAAPC